MIGLICLSLELLTSIFADANNLVPICSHSDNNLVELGEETIKEDDRAVLLEGGLTRSASAKFHSASIKTNLMRLLSLNFSVVTLFSMIALCKPILLFPYISRFLTMEDSFLLENRATLRAMLVICHKHTSLVAFCFFLCLTIQSNAGLRLGLFWCTSIYVTAQIY